MSALLAALARGGGDSPGALVGRAPTAVALFDRALVCRWVNPAFEEMTGTAASGLLGRAGAEVLAAWAGAPELLAVTLAEGTAGQLAGTVPDRPGGDGWWWICACAPLEEAGREPFGVAVYALAARAAPRDELVSAQARLAVLAEASERIGSSLDVETSSGELARFAVPRFADLVTVELLTDPQAPGGTAAGPVRAERTAVADATGAAAAADPPLRHGRGVRYSPQDAAARSLRERRVVLSAALLSDEDLAQWSTDPALRAGYTAAGIGTALVVPLHTRGRTLGVLTAGRARTRPGEPRSARPRCRCCGTSPTGRPSASTTPSVTPAPRASRWTCSGPCWRSPAARTPTSNSPPGTARRARRPWSAGTGSRPSGSRTAALCWSSATSWATAWRRPWT
ncbi:PAS domain-containing protein [Streptacidiphilus monticola]